MEVFFGALGSLQAEKNPGGRGSLKAKSFFFFIVSSSTIGKIYEITLFTKIGTKSALFTKMGTKFS